MSPDALDLRLIVRRLVDEASDRLAADAVALWLRGADGSELHLALAVGFERPATTSHLTHRPAAHLRDWLVPRRLPAVVTLKRHDVTGDRAWLEAEAIHSLLAVPVAADGTPVGVLAAFRRRRPFPVGYLARAAGIAATAAPAVHAAARLEEQRERAERAETLLGVAQALIATPDLQSALEEVGRRTARALGARRCDVQLWGAAAPVEASAPPVSALVVPIARKEDVIGRLVLTGPPGAGWTPSSVELATAIAGQVAQAADPARVHGVAPRDLVESRATLQKLVQGETLRALAELAGGAAHHLNNLLTIVVGRVQLVLRSTDDERVLRPLRIVERAAKDGAEVVRRLQQFARVRQIAQPQPVSVDDILRDVVTLLQAHWQHVGRPPEVAIQVETRFGGVPPVAGDPTALREALTNIVLNAVDAMPDGGRLVIDTRLSHDTVTVAVRDTGVGMSASVQQRAQEPFFTTKGVKATGLGLSVAYGIVRSHGGDVAIQSVEGAGTTVTIMLPRSALPAAPEPVGPPPGPLRILLVDDETEVRDALADMLTSSGHAVLTASGGEEALAIVEREPGLDLVLTDLVMPGMTGWDLAAAAKARRPRVTVGLVTGWGEPLDEGDRPRREIDFVVDKPVTLETLGEALARVRRR
jgi:signal transduction histidine kinase/CheY-like chemotaxis protein